MKVKDLLISVFQEIIDLSAIHARYLKNHMESFVTGIGHQGIVIDVGANKGPYKPLTNCADYISADINPTSPVDVVCDICCLPFDTGVVDVIICTEVLEHVYDGYKALSEVNRVLKDGGYLIMTSPLLWGVHDKEDFKRWTEVGLKKLTEETGFSILQLEKQGGIFSAAAEIVRQMPYQSFGPYSINSRNWLKYVLLFLWYLLLIPLTRALSMFDFLDKKRDFTLGYSVLARKH